MLKFFGRLLRTALRAHTEAVQRRRAAQARAAIALRASLRAAARQAAALLLAQKAR